MLAKKMFQNNWITKNTNPQKITKDNGKQFLKKIEIMKVTCKKKENKSRDINKRMS